LLIIQGRNTTASTNYTNNSRELVAEIESQVEKGLTTWQVTEREGALMSEEYPLSLRVQLEQESFYIFAKMLLDKVAHAIGVYFGEARGCSFASHDDLTKSIVKYSELLGLEVNPSLVARMQQLKVDVADFRDKNISHEKSPRTITMRPLILDPDGTVRLSLHKVYPQESDINVVARPVDELLGELEDYVLRFLDFLRMNSDKTLA
jgi:hypothetical protein